MKTLKKAGFLIPILQCSQSGLKMIARMDVSVVATSLTLGTRGLTLRYRSSVVAHAATAK
jgi:hypothetical protein